jgi:hypothetical protein
MSSYTVPVPEMTDVEYYKLTCLIEAKELTIHDLSSLDRWVENHGRDGAWAPATEVIKTLESFRDRPGHRYGLAVRVDRLSLIRGRVERFICRDFPVSFQLVLFLIHPQCELGHLITQLTVHLR